MPGAAHSWEEQLRVPEENVTAFFFLSRKNFKWVSQDGSNIEILSC